MNDCDCEALFTASTWQTPRRRITYLDALRVLTIPLLVLALLILFVLALAVSVVDN